MPYVDVFKESPTSTPKGKEKMTAAAERLGETSTRQSRARYFPDGSQVPEELADIDLDSIENTLDFSYEAQKEAFRRLQLQKQKKAAEQDWPFEFALGPVLRFVSKSKTKFKEVMEQANGGALRGKTASVSVHEKGGASAYVPPLQKQYSQKSFSSMKSEREMRTLRSVL